MNTEDMFFLEVIFVGRVQGVGFRWTTKNLADGFEVTGYVKNLPNGTVEMVAEGEESEARKFLAALHARMSDYLEDSEVVTENFGPRRFTEFSIAY